MDWNSGFFPEPAGKTVAFNQLLDRVRSVHEEVCARNALLESQTVHNGQFARRKDDHWLPSDYLAPEDGPPPCRPPGDMSTPMVFGFQSTDILVRQQECLHRSIDTLTKQQENLCEQITKVFTLSTPPDGLQPMNTRFRSLRQSTRKSKRAIGKSCGDPGGGAQTQQHFASCDIIEAPADTTNGNEQHQGMEGHDDMSQLRASGGAASSRVSAIKKRLAEAAKSRFAVQTGGTQEFGHHSFYRQSMAAIGGEKVVVVRKRLRQFLVSNIFTIMTGVLILSYTCFIAIETNMIAQDPEMDSATIKLVHYVYTCIFLVELLIRFIANGWGTLYGEDAFWNRLDTFLIFTGIVEIILENTISAKVPGVRIGRMIRTVRLIRTFHNFHDFQKMVYALISSFKTLICSLALMIFVMFFFAVWLTQGAADLEMRAEIPDLELRYGDLFSTSYTLFLSVSGGISWDGCYMPLHALSWWSASGFMLYVVIVLFGLLNVITSVFVESVIRSVQHYKDIIVQDRVEERQIAIGHVKEVFRAVDSDGSGYVSIDEMEYFLQDPALRKYMDALDIEAGDTRLLFRLLDGDGSGVIDVDEFCEGCLRLKGSAKSIDIHTLIFRIKNFLDKWSDFTDYVVDSFSQIRDTLPTESVMMAGLGFAKKPSKNVKYNQ